MSVLELSEVSKTYKGTGQPVTAVCNSSLKVSRGEMVALYGASGSGKTTMLMLASGLEQPDSGEVSFKGCDLEEMSSAGLARLRRRQLGFVFQTFNLVPALSAIRNVVLPLLFDGMDKRKAMERAQSLLKAVGLEERANHRPHELSGGEQQRVAIARALVAEPDLILADEPTGNLDSARGKEILSIMSELCRSEGVGVIVATHDPIATTYSDRILFIRDGRVRETQEGEEAGMLVEMPSARV